MIDQMIAPPKDMEKKNKQIDILENRIKVQDEMIEGLRKESKEERKGSKRIFSRK